MFPSFPSFPEMSEAIFFLLIVSGVFALCVTGLISMIVRKEKKGSPPLWGWKYFFLLVALFTIFALFATHGTGDFEENTGMHGAAYDDLAAHLLRGSVTVDMVDVLEDTIIVNGKTTMYFGPLPALLRMPVLQLSPSLNGHLPRSFSFAAAILLAAAVILVFHEELGRNTKLKRTTKHVLLILSVVGVCLGTTVPYLVAEASVFNEAILWAFCSWMWAAYFFFSLLRPEGGSAWHLLGFSVAAACALLSRVTFGIPLYVILTLLSVMIFFRSRLPWLQGKHIFRSFSGSRRRLVLVIALCLLPAALALLFQFRYNAARFGSALTFDDPGHKLYCQMGNESLCANIVAYGSFNLRRLPTLAGIYFRPVIDDVSFWRTIPFAPVSDVLPWKLDENVLSLTILSPWLLLGSLAGFVSLWRERNTLKIVAALLFLGQAVLILSYYLATERYVTDLYPLPIFGYAACLASAGNGHLIPWVKARWCRAGIVGLLSVSVCCSALLGGAVAFLWSTWQPWELPLGKVQPQAMEGAKRWLCSMRNDCPATNLK